MIKREDVDAGRVDFADIVEPDAATIPSPAPGEILRDVMEDHGITAYALAKAMKVPGNRVLALLAGRRAVTADTALRLAAALGTSAEMWMGLQAAHDLERAKAAGVGGDVTRLAA